MAFLHHQRKSCRQIAATLAAAAVSCLAFSADAHCKSANGLLRSGNSQYKKEQYDKALEYYSKAAALAPDNKKALYNMGNALYKKGELDKARESYQASAADKKLSQASIFNEGNAIFKQEKYKEAAMKYKEALLRDPGDKDAKYNLQIALQKKNNNQCQNPKNNNQNQNNQNKNQNQDKKPDNTKNKPSGSGMSKEDSERIMQMAKEKEKNNAKPDMSSPQMQKQGGQKPPPEEDW